MKVQILIECLKNIPKDADVVIVLPNAIGVDIRLIESVDNPIEGKQAKFYLKPFTE